MKSTSAILAVLTAVVLWGTTYLAIKVGMSEIPPITLALVRSAIASLVLAAVLFREFPLLIKNIKKDFWSLFIVGLTGIFLLHILQNIALQWTSTALVSILINTSPLFILFLARFTLQEKFTLPKILGVAAGFIGMLFVVLAGENLSEIWKSQSFLGNMLVLGAALSWSVFSVFNKKLLKRNYSPLTLTLVANVFGTILLLPTALFLEPVHKIWQMSALGWGVIVYLSIFVSAGAVFLWNFALSRMEVSRVAMYDYLIPVLAILIGVFFLEEKFTFLHLIGTGLILGGLYVTERSYKK